MSRVFVITGPSGVGKGTLIAELLVRVPDLQLSTSATTRAPREGEQDGREYHFMDRDRFREGIERGEFVEWAEYSGNLYGTLRSDVERRIELGKGVILEIEVEGARQIREAMPDALTIFISPPNPAVLRERLERRGTDPGTAIARRLRTAEAELAARDEFRCQIVNDDLERAAGQLEGVVRESLALDSDA